MRGYSDTSFTSNKDSSSQRSMLIVLSDKVSNTSIIHYATWKSRWVVRSILATEVYGLSAFHDCCQIISHDLELIIGRKLPFFLLLDSKSIFGTITKLYSFAEKWLIIDNAALR